ncbi:SAXO1 protein, partial [Centropus unirufus]|nr:SAXO1 protein [Centropus unirufus]
SAVYFPCRCHRCPHLPTRPYEKSEKPCTLSEYMERYPLYPFTLPRGSFKPQKAYKMAEIPMEGISTTKKDYVAHEMLPQKPKPPQKPAKSDERMDLTSTYKQHYNPYPITQVPPCLPRSAKHIPDAQMDTRTTYKGDYVRWNESKTEPIRPNDGFRSSEEKFDHRTNVQDDYLYRGPVATQSFKPLYLAPKSKIPFENITNYRVNYVPHPRTERYVHKYEKYKANEEPFDGSTIQKISYKGLAGEPAKLIRPQRMKPLDDVPFSTTTEFQEKYKAWPPHPVFTKKTAVYQPPVEKMDLCTTSQIDYKYSNGKPAKMCQFSSQLRKNTDVFNNSSVMKEDYKPWLCKRLKPIIQAPQLTFPAEPMDCLTTFQAHYVPHPLTVTKNYKPGWSVPEHSLIDAATTYATSYTPKGIVKCLASYKDPPGYALEGTDADGHRLYLPAPKRECSQSVH